MNLVGYADESGTHDPSGCEPGSDVAVVCGYVSNKEDWEIFTDDWNMALKEYQITAFHMAEFMDQINRKSDESWPYFGWEASKRDSFIRSLISIINRNILFGIGGALNVVDYHIIAPNWLKAEVESPYHFCFQLFFDCLIPMLEEFADPLSDGEQVAFFFDQHKQFEYRAMKAFHLIKELRDTQHRLGATAFVDKAKHQQLQAADLIAYLVRSSQSRKLKTRDPKIPPGNWERLLISNRNVNVCYYDASNLKPLIERMLRDRLSLLDRNRKQ